MNPDLISSILLDGLMAAIAATRLICERKLVIPSDKMRLQSPPLSLKSPFPGRITRILHKYQIASTAVTICPSTVATAAPIIPQRHTKINTGSKIVFNIAPASVDAIANFGLPSARIIGFSACPNI